MLILALALQAVTTCRPVMNTVQCSTENTGPVDYGSRQAKVDMSPLIAARAGRVGRSKPSKAQRKAGKMIAAGDCAGAEAFALSEGDFNLATDVRYMCAVRKSPR